MVIDRPARARSMRARHVLRGTLAAAAACLLLTGCGLFAASPKAPTQAAGSTTEPPTDTPPIKPPQVTVRSNSAGKVPSGLGGAIGVVIDNEVAARPQSGIQNASLVFEAPAEGGITRFLALFWQHGSSQIGPVRSARIYFDQLAQAYDIPLAHAGGNVDALKAMKTLGIKNIDEIWTPGAWHFFWRSTTRQAPHNLYTSSALLLKAVHSLGLTLGPIPTWDQGSVTGGKAVGEVSVFFSGVEDVHWYYKDGMYTRYEYSKVDDTLTGQPVEARAVLLLNVGQEWDPDAYTPGALKLLMTGHGTGELAADGREVAVRWERTATGPFRIVTATGQAPQPIPAPPLWVELVPPVASVTFGAAKAAAP
jgi:hypothetical protein